MADESSREKCIKLGMTSDMYDIINKRLGREPTTCEGYIFAAMWSEHISYKSSRHLLKDLPTDAPHVLQGPGEGAGIVKIDADTAVAFKIESHNHPSAVEPFEGAATGVGGIVRDILSVGARPIALLDSLRFGDLSKPLQKHRLERVVSGIANYGNCIGVPVVGGDIEIHPSFEDNVLVNAMAVGILHPDNIVLGKLGKEGQKLVLYGSATGRDGIHGAAFSSVELDPEEDQRSAVQTSDPFMEKLIIEATLELIKYPWTIGIQDLGAGGLAGASIEMAIKSKKGVSLDLDCIHIREKNMKDWELLLSESQERMLICIDPSGLDEAEAIWKHWDIPYSVVGTVIESLDFRITQKSSTILDLPTHIFSLPPPQIDILPSNDDSSELKNEEYVSENIDKKMLFDTILKANHANCSWIYEQYDSMVGTQTRIGPGSHDAAIIQPHGKSWSLAITVDGPSPHRNIHAQTMAHNLIAEGTRNITAVGGRPLGITNCLNFANPEDPHVYNEFATTIKEIGDACRHFGIPVTGGNVSLYNFTETTSIPPTPIIGMLGVITKTENTPPMGFSKETSAIGILGEAPESWDLDLDMCIATNEAVHDLIANKALSSCHDISSGGIWLSLIECALQNNVGFVVSIKDNNLLLDERGHRFLISTTQPYHKAFEALQTPVKWIGKTTKENWVSVDGILECSLSDISSQWNSRFSTIMDS